MPVFDGEKALEDFDDEEALPAFEREKEKALEAFESDGALLDFEWETGLPVGELTGATDTVGLLVGVKGAALDGLNDTVGDCVGDFVTVAGQNAPLAGVTSATVTHPMKLPTVICSKVQSSMLYCHAIVLTTCSLSLLTPTNLRIIPFGKYSCCSVKGVSGSNFVVMEVNSMMSPSEKF